MNKSYWLNRKIFLKLLTHQFKPFVSMLYDIGVTELVPCMLYGFLLKCWEKGNKKFRNADLSITDSHARYDVN